MALKELLFSLHRLFMCFIIEVLNFQQLIGLLIEILQGPPQKIQDVLKRQHFWVDTVDMVDRVVFRVERVDKMSADRIDGGHPFSSVVDIRLRRKNKI